MVVWGGYNLTSCYTIWNAKVLCLFLLYTSLGPKRFLKDLVRMWRWHVCLIRTVVRCPELGTSRAGPFFQCLGGTHFTSRTVYFLKRSSANLPTIVTFFSGFRHIVLMKSVAFKGPFHGKKPWTLFPSIGVVVPQGSKTIFTSNDTNISPSNKMFEKPIHFWMACILEDLHCAKAGKENGITYRQLTSLGDDDGLFLQPTNSWVNANSLGMPLLNYLLGWCGVGPV